MLQCFRGNFNAPVGSFRYVSGWVVSRSIIGFLGVCRVISRLGLMSVSDGFQRQRGSKMVGGGERGGVRATALGRHEGG